MRVHVKALMLVLWAFGVPALLLPNCVEAQTGTVVSNPNLRPSPSSSQAAIRTLPAGEQIQVLSLMKTNNYYNVATTRAEQGWIAERAPIPCSWECRR